MLSDSGLNSLGVLHLISVIDFLLIFLESCMTQGLFYNLMYHNYTRLQPQALNEASTLEFEILFYY